MHGELARVRAGRQAQRQVAARGLGAGRHFHALEGGGHPGRQLTQVHLSIAMQAQVAQGGEGVEDRGVEPIQHAGLQVQGVQGGVALQRVGAGHRGGEGVQAAAAGRHHVGAAQQRLCAGGVRRRQQQRAQWQCPQQGQKRRQISVGRGTKVQGQLRLGGGRRNAA